MSVPLRLLESRQLSDGAKVLAMVILALADADGVCRQRFSVLATAAGTAERTARRRALELDRGGWISREKSASGLQGLRPIYGRWDRPPDKNTAGGSPPTGTEVATPPALDWPVAGKGLGWGAGELGIVSLLAQGLTAVEETAASFHRHVGLMLSNMGCDVHREVEVAVEGERGARVDLMAKGPTGWIALELDRKSPRKNSIRKLRRLNALRVVLLREPGGDFEWPDGIHAVVVAGQAARWRLGGGAGGWSPVSSIPDDAQVWSEGQQDDGHRGVDERSEEQLGGQVGGPRAPHLPDGRSRGPGSGHEALEAADGAGDPWSPGRSGDGARPPGEGEAAQQQGPAGGDRPAQERDRAADRHVADRVIPPLPGGAPREDREHAESAATASRGDGRAGAPPALPHSENRPSARRTREADGTAAQATGGGSRRSSPTQEPKVAPPMEGMASGFLTSPAAEPRPRKGYDWNPTPAEAAVLRAILDELQRLHAAYGWTTAKGRARTWQVSPGTCRTTLARLRAGWSIERVLTEVRAMCWCDATGRNGRSHRAGEHATLVRLYGAGRWTSNKADKAERYVHQWHAAGEPEPQAQRVPSEATDGSVAPGREIVF